MALKEGEKSHWPTGYLAASSETAEDSLNPRKAIVRRRLEFAASARVDSASSEALSECRKLSRQI
jgi:hypothetical protein